MKRRRLEFEITFFVYILAALLSGIFAFFIAQNLNKLSERLYLKSGILDAFIPLLISALFNVLLTLSKNGYEFSILSVFQSVKRSGKSTLITGAVWAMILLIAKNDVTRSRYFFLLTLIFYFCILAAFWYIVPRKMILNFYKTSGASYVAVLTSRKRAPSVTDRLKKDWARKIVGIGIVDESFDIKEGDEIDHVPVMADSRNVLDWIQHQALDEVFIFLDRDELDGILPVVHEMMKMGIRVHMNIPEIDSLDRKLKIIEQDGYVPAIYKELKYSPAGDAILTLNQPTMRIRGVILKRTVDIVGGIIGMAITCVLFVILGTAIRLDSPGPVIFAQERIGKNGRHFKMYKFRSMYEDAEKRKKELMDQNEMNGLMFKMENDPRITKVGKFIRKTSLDEFPQFWNVLKGEMSLVGTRPPTVGEFNQYSSYHKRRLAMKPGITGMWQVSGRSDITDFEEVVHLDCEYIDNWSLGLDFKIILETVGQVFRHKGAR